MGWFKKCGGCFRAFDSVVGRFKDCANSVLCGDPKQLAPRAYDARLSTCARGLEGVPECSGCLVRFRLWLES